jgi:hypothetical protein
MLFHMPFLGQGSVKKTAPFFFLTISPGVWLFVKDISASGQ